MPPPTLNSEEPVFWLCANLARHGVHDIKGVIPRFRVCRISGIVDSSVINSVVVRNSGELPL